MKQYKQLSKIALLLLVTVSLLSSCTNDIDIPVTDKKIYENATTLYAYLSHQNMPDISVDIDLRQNSISCNINLELTKPATEGIKVQVEAFTDSLLIANYNFENKSNYKAFPTGQVMLSNNGEITVEAGKTKSAPLTVTFSKNSTLTQEGTEYILPLRIKGNTIKTLDDRQILWFHIRVGKAATIRPRTVSNIACIQINDVNPLCAGIYKLKDSKEPFFDQISIFAANINWDVQKKRAYITFNENLTSLLAQRDKYIKPLQDMGIKVTLSLLGNRDGVCFRNFNTEGARDFAYEIKSVIDAYGFDGIMFDEEYMNYGSNGLPQPNNTSWIQLCYELKTIMPDKLLTLYTYDIHDDFKGSVSGKPAGELIDYAFRYATNDYSTGIIEQINSFNQLNARKYGPLSIMLYDDYMSWNYGGVRPDLESLKTSHINQIETIKEKYGCNFFYNLYGYCAKNAHSQNIINTLGDNGFDPLTNAIDYSDYFTVYAKILFGEEVFRDGYPFRKDY